MLVDWFIVLVGGYVVYRQETIENSNRQIKKELEELRRLLPKRKTDRKLSDVED